ncbi:MAG TPA: hypothetical protein VMZ53_07540 [Kofleriaceae bacterium]|nr:hypothetical protein [Kofleriaceae bacterium]
MTTVAYAETSSHYEETVRYETATSFGYEEASVKVEYQFITCFGNFVLTYRLVPDSLTVGEWYRFDGERELVGDEAPPRVSSVEFAGTVRGIRGDDIKDFSDGTAHSKTGMGCYGQTVTIGRITDITGNPKPTKDDIARALGTFSIRVRRAQGSIRNSAIDDRMRNKRLEKKRADEQAERDAKRKADEAKRIKDAQDKKDEQDRKDAEAKNGPPDKTGEKTDGPNPSDQEVKKDGDGQPSVDAQVAANLENNRKMREEAERKAREDAERRKPAPEATPPPQDDSWKPRHKKRTEPNEKSKRALEWLERHTGRTELHGYYCSMLGMRHVGCDADSYVPTIDEYGIDGSGNEVAIWNQVQRFNVTDMGRIMVIYGPLSLAPQGIWNVMYLTPLDASPEDYLMQLYDASDFDDARVLGFAPVRDRDAHEDEPDPDPTQPRFSPGAEAAAAAFTGMEESLDRAGIFGEHHIAFVHDGLGASADMDGTPAPSRTGLTMTYCRVAGAQLGFGYASTGKSTSTATDFEYRTAGTISFYDKGGYLTAGGGLCVPNRWVQPYALVSFELPLGGSRTAVGMNELRIAAGEGDTIGGRFVPTVGVNVRIPKIRIGLGLRASYTKVLPRNTLVDATDGTGSTWSAEGGGAGYFSLGIQVLVYPFRSGTPSPYTKLD